MTKRLIIITTVLLFTLVVCVSLGSVPIPLLDTCRVFYNVIIGRGGNDLPQRLTSILIDVRLPRVLTVAFVGAALSVCGACMQGLLRNPLADGSTLGVSAGASLGAVLAIAFNVSLPGLPGAATFLFSMSFAFFSLLIILALAYQIDFTMSTQTVILVGVIFSMFASSITSLLIVFAGSKVKNIMFWSMGSFAGSSYGQALIMGLALLIGGGLLICKSDELNAFAVGEDNARNIGVPVKKVKLQVMILVAILIGIAVAISGTIGFVGLIIPHITRFWTGPNHRKLLPFSMFFGAVFLMLADLVSRIMLRPLELPIGVITSFIGSIVFVYIFYRFRRQA
jgi:iron complex transport system permease protein